MKRLIAAGVCTTAGFWLIYVAGDAQRVIDQYPDLNAAGRLTDQQEAVTLMLWLGLAALALAFVLVVHYAANRRKDVSP